MASKLARWQRREDDEQGASLVEFALVVPIFVLLLFSLIDFGMVFGGFITVRAEVNAAARNIAVDQLANGCSGQTAFYCTAQGTVGSTLPGVAGAPDIAVAFPDGATVGAPVAVCARTTLESVTGILGFLLDGRTVTVQSEVRLEQAPTETVGDNPAGITCGT